MDQVKDASHEDDKWLCSRLPNKCDLELLSPISHQRASSYLIVVSNDCVTSLTLGTRLLFSLWGGKSTVMKGCGSPGAMRAAVTALVHVRLFAYLVRKTTWMLGSLFYPVT